MRRSAHALHQHGEVSVQGQHGAPPVLHARYEGDIGVQADDHDKVWMSMMLIMMMMVLVMMMVIMVHCGSRIIDE